MEEEELLKEYPTAYHPNDPAAEQLERLVTHFEDVAQSWSKVVYPALFAFIILAIYGFYLIFSLTTDVRKVADSIQLITTQYMGGQIGNLNDDMSLGGFMSRFMPF